MAIGRIAFQASSRRAACVSVSALPLQPRVGAFGQHSLGKKLLDPGSATAEWHRAIVIDVAAPAATAIRVPLEKPFASIIFAEPKHLSAFQSDQACALRIEEGALGKVRIGFVSTIGCIIPTRQTLVASRCRTSSSVPPGARPSRVSIAWQKSCSVAVGQRSSSAALNPARSRYYPSNGWLRSSSEAKPCKSSRLCNRMGDNSRSGIIPRSTPTPVQ